MRVVDMHQPDRWGIVQFSNATDAKANPTKLEYYDEWPIREMAMSVYYAEKIYNAQNGEYTNKLSDIQPYTTTPLDGTCLKAQPMITLERNASHNVIGYTASVQNERYIATVTADRYLQ